MPDALRQMDPQENWRTTLAEAREAEGENGRTSEACARYVAASALYVWRAYMQRYREHDRLRRKIEGRP